MTVPKYERKAVEKIWNVLQEIEEKRQLGSKDSPVRLIYFPNFRNRDDVGVFEIRKTVLEKLQSEKVITGLHRVSAGGVDYWSFALSKDYQKVFAQYEKQYSENARQYEESKKEPSEKAAYSFNKDRGILIIRGKEISFKGEGRRVPYLDYLVRNKDYAYHSEVAEVLEGANVVNGPKKTYYEVCRGINARLIQLGITDFLEFDFNKARINPSYKKEPQQTP